MVGIDFSDMHSFTVKKGWLPIKCFCFVLSLIKEKCEIKNKIKIKQIKNFIILRRFEKS